MKFFAIIAICFVFLMALGVKSSLAQENVQQLEELSQGLEGDSNGGLELNRQKRLTCSINPSLCTAHCRVKGFRRSYCNKSKVCVCRK